MDHMEFSIALPSYVEITKAGMEWEHMKQRLHAHINHSSDVHHQQIQGLVKAFLINIAAEQVQEVFNMFGLSYEEAVKFNRILQRLEDVCLPRFLIIYNRYKFFTCKQTCNGKFNDFLKNLVKWSENCEFGDLKDILMKDCIITGISDNAVRQCLMETEELSFFKSLEICRGVELSQKMKNISVATEGTECVDVGSNTESQHVAVPCFKSYNDISTNTTVDFTSDVETDHQNNSELNLYQELEENKLQNQAIQTELKSNVSTLASSENDVEKKKLPKPRRSKRCSQTHKSTMSFLCDNCDKRFPDQLSMKLHLCCPDEQQKQTVNLKCQVCKLVMTDRSALIKHRLVHKGEKRFKCETCSANFSNASHLKVHMRLHTGERPFTCDTCGASFPESSKLKSHLRKHTGERPFTCEVCQRKFAWTAAYTRHLRTHTGEKPYTCEFCGGNFADFTSLQRHRRTHTKEKPYSCDTCQAKFTDPSALKLHKRGHTGERPYTCQKCKSSFVRSQHLKEHMKLHTGEKPYECKTCGAKFVEASKLKSHIRRHTGEKPYLCKICGTSFAWTAAYTRHMRTHTRDKPYFCDYCGSRFADHSTLTRHTRTHTGERPYVCKNCGSNFADNSSLNRHMRIHTGEKSYVCEVCGSSFAVKSYLVRHMRTHTGEKPYHCDTCGSKFTDSSKLSRHKKIHSKSGVKQIVENQECEEQEEEQFAQLQPLHLVPQDSDPLQLHHQHLLDSQPAEPTPEEQHPMTINEDLQHSLLLSTNLIPLTHMLPFNASIIS